ncbi:hypothetical protein HKX48_007400 [Thoreauomyces humboldtii]|nr:hypothetical protein HKX48_007400 [Thoreauomyces humboldtii]
MKDEDEVGEETKAPQRPTKRVKFTADTKEPPFVARVGYVFSEALRRVADRLPSNLMRATFVHSLVTAYGLPQHMKIISPIRTGKNELMTAHSEAYAEFILGLDDLSAEERESLEEDDLERYGLQHDCPVFEGISSYCSQVAGGTLAAAQALVSRDVDVAINWDGGRHHASRDRAAGFCYVSDIVIGVIALQERFKRILYLDMDVHHGDGVESAFLFSPRVYTCSFHLHDPSVGFYPGTGGVVSPGRGKGASHALNVPLRRNLRSPSFIRLFRAVTEGIVEAWDPDCVVLQCGADGVDGNLGKGEGWNLGCGVVAKCVEVLGQVVKGRPMMLVGGGGYDNPTTARCWAAATAAAIEVAHPGRVKVSDVEDDVPEHALWTEYARRAGGGGMRSDDNEKDGFIEEVLKTAIKAVRLLLSEGS